MEIVIFFVGVIVGLIVAVSFSRWRPDGRLKIDRSKPDKDIYRLEIENLDMLDRKSMITLRVDHTSDFSHN